MGQIKIIKEKPISLFELKEELEKIEKKDKELNFRAKRVQEYVNIFSKLNKDQYKKIYEGIIKLNIPRMGEHDITKIIDLLPTSVDELKTILSNATISVSKENMKKIVDIINANL